ncbi:MAG: hypothetical protein ACOC1P_01965 [Minisyncoccales bacterium]
MASLDKDFSFFRGFRLNLPSLDIFSENSRKDIYILYTGKFDWSISENLEEFDEIYDFIENPFIFYPEHEIYSSKT